MENINNVLNSIKKEIDTFYDKKNISVKARNQENYAGYIWNGSKHCFLDKSKSNGMNQLNIDLYVERYDINTLTTKLDTKQDVYIQYKTKNIDWTITTTFIKCLTETEILENFETFLSTLFEVIKKGKFNQSFIADNLITLTYLFKNNSFEEIAILMEQQEMKTQLSNF